MVNFINTFLSYLLLMVVILVVAGIGVAIGIILRKRKNSQTPIHEIAEEK